MEDLEFALTKGEPSKHQLFKSLPLVIRSLSTTLYKTKFSCLYPGLAPVVQTLDSAIHWINHYPLDNSIGFASVYLLVIYPVDSAIHRLNNWGLVYSLYPKYVDERRKKENNG